MASKGGRVTSGGIDSARFGGTAPTAPASSLRSSLTASATATGKTGRLGTDIAADAGKTGRVGSSMSSVPSVGRQSSVGGVYANGGMNAGLPGAIAPATARFGENVPAAKGKTGLASALKTQQLPSNYGMDFASKVRESNKIADARLSAWDGALGTIRAAEAQKAVNPATGKVDPYNGLVGAAKGKKAPTHADLTNMTIAEVNQYQKGMLKAGHLSTAVGAYQIISKTLLSAAEKAGMDPNKTKFTAATQDQLARTLADDVRATQASNSRRGLAPANFSDALAQEWAGLSMPDGRSAYAKDGVNKANVSYSRTLGAATDLVNSGAVGAARLSGTAPGPIKAPSRPDAATTTTTTRVAAAPTAQKNVAISPDVRVAAAYAGVDAQTVANYAARTGISPRDAAFAVTPKESLPGYKAPSYVDRAGRPVAAPAQTTTTPKTDRVATTAAPATAPAAQRFGEKYLGTVPTPTARPADAVKERSVPDKIVAGAIDAGVGLIPGVGMAAGLYSLAAPMVGLPTFGDMALSLRDKSDFNLNASLAKGGATQGGSSGSSIGNRFNAASPQDADTNAAPTPAAPPTVAAASFEEKYLGYRDPTPRPTPAQRWGGMGANDVPYSL